MFGTQGHKYVDIIGKLAHSCIIYTSTIQYIGKYNFS